MKIIEEGETKLMVPESQTLSKKDKVFYNPIMEVNRDISVSVIQSFLNNFQRDEFLICDPLGGSGARGLRYANELKFKGDLKVVIGDINPNAVKLANENLKLNGNDNVEIFHEDANVLLSRNFRVFNVVDLDPFGSPAPYLDSAIRATITKNGVLCMTATDTAVLCGAYRKSCIRRYNAIPLRKDKEVAVRILIGYAIRMASKYDIGLKPIFSHATDHYVRTFLVTERGANKADNAIGELGYMKSINEEKIFRSFNNGYEKGFGGPLYLGPINDPNIVNDALKVSIERNYSQKAINVLDSISKECELNQIGCYDIHEICSFIKKLAPPISELIDNLKEKGFNATRVHYNSNGVKTDAKLIDVIESIVEYNKP
ncbi:MAG: tRNA (guanine26-N2/guanine27-N2)-dimethyltransferase [Methanothermococcus sp.]|jgi:tRNA (guanine26-N2/guanine27-N2)-dimethyltransferase|uniref:tRNA (guanine(10)-N(2))-dimethyltransferase n=1 Tax=Methanothermococcus TaxID=155862 RepID=UPI0003688CF7|nr:MULTISPECIES: tRNA (guanine(10)-N(2))-dimethyltransferase [Methanothermococcus]MDK2790207.1 tRNA (guanine26-N2/guanine27-N2)-dimethyltransferase [Methanothermococcus sp.]MDK2987190.1 tRNA (guanine26-N2/guanine27-N2)-dimethyltransferase [Methanothermococcus sp.]